MDLPKQWKHWCSLAKLEPVRLGQPRRGYRGWYTLRGYGRWWRVNDENMLQCGDKYEDFDRWALSEITEAPMPKTRVEVLKIVHLLILEHEGSK